MRKISKAEAGRMGAEKSKQTNLLKKQKRINNYMNNPNRCVCCEAILDYNNRHKKFCNNSCSATYNNLRRKKRTTVSKWNCLNCGKEHQTVAWRIGKYCNNECQIDFQTKERIRLWLEEGKDWTGQNPQWAKKYLLELRGNNCEICGISDWNGRSIVLEMDHINGDHKDNHPNNLRMICPNCHSQTDTYKAKNKGKGRAYRVNS